MRHPHEVNYEEIVDATMALRIRKISNHGVPMVSTRPCPPQRQTMLYAGKSKLFDMVPIIPFEKIRSLVCI